MKKRYLFCLLLCLCCGCVSLPTSIDSLKNQLLQESSEDSSQEDSIPTLDEALDDLLGGSNSDVEIDDLEQVMPIEEANFSIPWTETGFFTFLIRDDALFLVAEEDGEILGYLGILISFDESEITNVCVAEKARRRGIGRALMEELFRRMQERKVRVIHLDVRIGNTPARNLYESLGFVQDGLRKGYYDLPKEDAVLMSRTDESVPKR